MHNEADFAVFTERKKKKGKSVKKAMRAFCTHSSNLLWHFSVVLRQHKMQSRNLHLFNRVTWNTNL